MSNKIYIDEESYNYLIDWTDKNKDKVFIGSYYFEKFQIMLKKTPLVGYAEFKKNKLKINIKDDRILAHCTVERTPDGENDYGISFDIPENRLVKMTDEELEKTMSEIKLVANCCIMSNGFLFFGNMVENKTYQASGRNDGGDKVIVFRKYKEQYYAVPVGTHRSPEGIFEVRGHLRHYKKTGKVIWIDPYMKGLDDDDIE